MSDSTGVKQFIEEAGQAAGEVVKDVKNELGQIAQEMGQSISGQQFTPQQIQQQQINDQKDLAEIRRKVRFYQQHTAEVNKVLEENKQTEAQRIQAQQQEQQKAEQEEAQKAQLPQAVTTQAKGIREDIAETMPELKGGRGKGG